MPHETSRSVRHHPLALRFAPRSYQRRPGNQALPRSLAEIEDLHHVGRDVHRGWILEERAGLNLRECFTGARRLKRLIRWEKPEDEIDGLFLGDRFDCRDEFAIRARDTSADDALTLWSKNPRLEAVVITERGRAEETPIGIATATDLIKLLEAR
jgi:hypothetical protein